MFDTLEIIFEGKTIEGFNLGNWKMQQGDEKFNQISLELQDLIVEVSYKPGYRLFFRWRMSASPGTLHPQHVGG